MIPPIYFHTVLLFIFPSSLFSRRKKRRDSLNEEESRKYLKRKYFKSTEQIEWNLLDAESRSKACEFFLSSEKWRRPLFAGIQSHPDGPWRGSNFANLSRSRDINRRLENEISRSNFLRLRPPSAGHVLSSRVPVHMNLNRRKKKKRREEKERLGNSTGSS